MTDLNRIKQLSGIEILDEAGVFGDPTIITSTKMIERALDILRCLPLNEWVTTPEVCARMGAYGHTVVPRSIQRNLAGYAQLFGIQRRLVGNGSELEWKRTTPFKID